MTSPARVATHDIKIRRAVHRSDVGKQRRTNEDGVLCLAKIPLFAVADGTGGREASRAALTVLHEESPQLVARGAEVAANPNTASRLAIGRFLEGVFANANAAVHAAAEKTNDRRIATTLVAASIVGPFAYVAHVGDSRAYLLRQGELRCLTNDHTLAALQLRRGDITPAEYQTSPFRRTLSQALGVTPALEVDIAELQLVPGDTLLIATNGVSRAVADETIALALREPDADKAADALMQRVFDAGAPDNATFIIIQTEAALRSPVRSDGLEQAVRQSFLYRTLTGTEWLQLGPYLEVLEAKPGEIVRRTGEPALGLCAIAGGRISLTQHSGETYALGAGDHFGALALATDGPELETATATETTWLYVLTRARFKDLVRANPALSARLTFALLETLGNRLGTMTTRLGQILDAVHGR